jgi:hypothetical protein
MTRGIALKISLKNVAFKCVINFTGDAENKEKHLVIVQSARNLEHNTAIYPNKI